MEEQQVNKSRRCGRCTFYKRYHANCAVSFYREDVGYCLKFRTPTESGEVCEEWERRLYGKFTNLDKDAALKVLTKMAREVADITQILCEDE